MESIRIVIVVLWKKERERDSVEIMFLCHEIMNDWFACCCVTNGCLANIYVELDGYVAYVSWWNAASYH